MPAESRKDGDGSERRPEHPALPPGTEAAGQVIGGKGSVPEWMAQLDELLNQPPPDGA